VQYRRPACSERAIATELHHLRLALRLVYPGVDWTWLLAATKRIAAQAKSRPQKHHLITSERLYALGFALMDEAIETAGAVGAVSKACAFDYRDGLMIALLSAIPIRRRTFAGLRIGTQLVRSGTRPGGNRFNDDNRGAWYCGFDADTAIGEVSYHLTRELEAVGRFENVTDYAELIADFFGPFHDLRGADAEVDPVLHNDPAIAYPAGQTLARQLRIEHASNGIIRICGKVASGVLNGRARQCPPWTRSGRKQTRQVPPAASIPCAGHVSLAGGSRVRGPPSLHSGVALTAPNAGALLTGLATAVASGPEVIA
jgi:hypothetical protein